MIGTVGAGVSGAGGVIANMIAGEASMAIMMMSLGMPRRSKPALRPASAHSGRPARPPRIMICRVIVIMMSSS
jgi:hypothetical protein